MSSQQCLLCHKANLKIIFRHNKYSILYCPKCQFGRISPLLNTHKLKKIYSKSYFNNKQEKAYFYDAQKKLKLVKKYTQPPLRLLDWGCGLGQFLKVAKTDGYRTTGYDISSYAASFVKNKHNIEVFDKTYKLSGAKFDLITAWDVIEHLPDFFKTLETINNMLDKNGLFFLTTPNLLSLEARLTGRLWYGYKKVPEHLNFFSPKSIKTTLSQTGFKTIKISRWGFYRSLGYLCQKTIPQFKPQLVKLGLKNKAIYLPVIDMAVIAVKK